MAVDDSKFDISGETRRVLLRLVPQHALLADRGDLQQNAQADARRPLEVLRRRDHQHGHHGREQDPLVLDQPERTGLLPTDG